MAPEKRNDGEKDDRTPRSRALLSALLLLPTGTASGWFLGAQAADWYASLGGTILAGSHATVAAAVAGLFVIGSVIYAGRNLSRVIAALALGPILGALLSAVLWKSGIAWDAIGQLSLPFSNPFPGGWARWMMSGAAVGLIAVVYLDCARPVWSGVVGGAVVGGVIGLNGQWGNDSWWGAPVAGALLGGILFRTALIAHDLRLPGGETMANCLGFGTVGAVFGTLLCGIGDLLATYGPVLFHWICRAGYIVDFLAFVSDRLQVVFSVPSGLCHLLGFPGGWLGGAMIGAFAGVLAGPVEADEAAHPLDFLLGGVLGLVDRAYGGRLFDLLFGDWLAGAVTGSLLFALLFASWNRPPDRRLAGALFAAAGLGVLLSLIARWSEESMWVFRFGGAAFGLAATVVYLRSSRAPGGRTT